MIKINPRQFNNYTAGMKKTKSEKVGQPSFSAAGVSKAEEILIENALINNHLGTFGKVLNKLSATAGEIQNILFIGFGTAFVAPIFIAYNKLAKEDDRTKKYSALRQPISAVIAVATGLGINYPIARWFNKASSDGRLSRFNMTAKPPSDLLKESYNKILKNMESSGKDGLKKLNTFDKYIFDSINDGETPIDSAKTFKAEFNNFQKFEKRVHDVTSSLAAKKLLDPNNKEGLRNISLKDYLVKYLDFEMDHHDKELLNPHSTKTKINEMSALTFLKKFGVYDGDKAFTESTVRALIAKNIYNSKFESHSNGDREFAKQILEFMDSTANEHKSPFTNKDELAKSFIEKYSKRGFTPEETKKIARIAELFVPEELKNVEKISAKQFLMALDLEKAIYEDPKIYDMKMPDFMIYLKEKTSAMPNLENLERSIDEPDLIKVVTKMASRMAKERAESAASAFKAYSKVQGIVLSLAILPFSCGVLNWSYPRVMEKLFPSLCGDKAPAKSDPPPAKSDVEAKKGENK